MRPRKAREFIPEVSNLTGVSQEAVTDIINMYWEEIRSSLSSLKYSRVHVTNLGDFVTKHWLIDEKIESLQRWEEKNKLKGLQEITARFKVAENLFALKHLKDVMLEETQRKDFIKLHKNKTNESKEKPNTDMEEQGPYSGGCNK